MFHFLAKLGRKRWVKYVVPSIGLAASFGYISFHMHGHQKIRNIFVASPAEGQEEQLSEELKELILQVYTDVKPHYKTPTLGTEVFKDATPIKYFCSSSIDPLNFGMSESKNGVLIGLPVYYNYKSQEDIPDEIPKFFSFKLLRSFSQDQEAKKEEEALKELGLDPNDPSFVANSLRLVDRSNPDMVNYLKSLALSEDAKRFSIARELFYADSYRIIAIFTGLLGTSILFTEIPRFLVKFAKLQNAHLASRMPIYAFSTWAALASFSQLATCIFTGYSVKADERALDLGEAYQRGAIEYLSKMIERNKALRNLHDELKAVYDPNGNVMRYRLFNFGQPELTDRLDRARKFIENKQKKEEPKSDKQPNE